MSDSIYANARAAALTGSLLGADRLSRMADCASADEAVKILQEVNFGEGAAADGEGLVAAEERRYTAFVGETAPSEKYAHFLLARYDYRNAEALMRAKHLRLDPKRMTGADGAYPAAWMEEKIYADDYAAFSPQLKEALAAADELFVGGGATGRKVNALFSRARFKELKALAAGDGVLGEIVSLWADAANIGVALRAKNAALAAEMTVEGGLLTAAEIAALAEGNADALREAFRYSPRKALVFAALEDASEGRPLSALERTADSAALIVLERQKYNDEGSLPFLRYCFRKAAELENVRIVLSCLSNGVEKAEIRARMRGEV